MLEQYEKKAQLNLKKVQGQVALIQNMINDKRYCVDVAQQVNAAIGMLRKVNDLILESHLNTCAAAKLNSKKKEERENFVRDLIYNFRITNK